MTQAHSQKSSMEEVVKAMAQDAGMTPEDFSELIIGGLEGWCAALQASESKAAQVGGLGGPNKGPASVWRSSTGQLRQRMDG
jgi:hypothetical protein